MFKRSFRLAIILIILLGISKYSTLLDNTKIKPYLSNVEVILQDKFSNVKSRFGSSDESDIISTGTIDSGTLIDYGSTGSAAFDGNDVLDEKMITSSKMDPEIVTQSDELSQTNEGNHSGSNIMSGKRIATMQVKNCISPRGKFVPKNNYIIAYESRSSSDCKWEKRYCNNGSLDGSYEYDSCFYSSAVMKQKEQAWLSKDGLKNIQKEYGVVEVIHNEVKNLGTNAGPGVIVDSSNSMKYAESGANDNNNGYTNNLKYSNNDPNKHYFGQPKRGINILSNGQTELNNHKLKTRSLKKQIIGYQGESFISNAHSLTAKNSYQQKICLTPRGSIISNGQFVTAFKSSVSDSVCELETRYCIEGKLLGSYSNPNCNGKQPYTLNKIEESSIPHIINTTEELLMAQPSPQVDSYAIYHQTDETEDTKGKPLFQFQSEGEEGNYNTSQIIIHPEYIIYHQEDEVK